MLEGLGSILSAGKKSKKRSSRRKKKQKQVRGAAVQSSPLSWITVKAQVEVGPCVTVANNACLSGSLVSSGAAVFCG